MKSNAANLTKSKGFTRFLKGEVSIKIMSSSDAVAKNNTLLLVKADAYIFKLINLFIEHTKGLI